MRSRDSRRPRWTDGSAGPRRGRRCSRVSFVHNLYYLISDVWDLEVLGGLLLSRVAQLFIEAYCVKMRGGTLRFQAQYLRRIRVPDPASLSAEVKDRLVQAFRSRDTDAATAAALDAYGIKDLWGVLAC